MTTSIEFAKAVTEYNLKKDTDRDFSSSETANIQHTNAVIRQAVRQHTVSCAKRTRHTSMQVALRQNVTLCCRQPRAMLSSMQSQRLR